MPFYVRHGPSTYERKKRKFFLSNALLLLFLFLLFFSVFIVVVLFSSQFLPQYGAEQHFAGQTRGPKKSENKNTPWYEIYTENLKTYEYTQFSFPFLPCFSLRLNIHEFQIKTISVCYIVYDVWYINIFNIISTNCKVIHVRFSFHFPLRFFFFLILLFYFLFSHLYVDKRS